MKTTLLVHLIAAAAGIACAQTVLVGGDLLNGNFNTPGGSGDVNYSAEPYWINLGSSGQYQVFLKDDETLDGTHNAVIYEGATRTPGADTGFRIREGDLFSLRYHWKDSYQWNDAADMVKIRLFITDDDTLSGTVSNLAGSISGISTHDDSYQLEIKNNIYLATPDVAGKKLFVALDTLEGNGISNGFARIDNLELTAINMLDSLQGIADTHRRFNLVWHTLPGTYYTVQQTDSLTNTWQNVHSNLFARSNAVYYASDLDRPNSFYRVAQQAQGGWVDPDTPLNAKPALAVPTGDNWVLDFSDEFNSFNRSKWTKSVSTSPRAARPAQGINDWWWRADHVSISDGTLALKISKHDSNTMYCGSVETRNLYETAYGFMEARINCSPIEKGAHTAFWLQGHNQNNVDGSGADGCEVDIFESAYGNGGINIEDRECQTVLHWDGYGASKQSATEYWNVENAYTGFHTFAAHGTPAFLDIYYDGVKKWRYTGVGIPQVAEWLWLSVGAGFGDGNFQTETYPSWSYVDYVRVWKSKYAQEL